MKRRKRKRTCKKLMSVVLMAAVAVAVSLGWHYYQDNGIVLPAFQFSASTSDASVYFIDVGQGDCELIRDHDKTVLIDAGEADKGNQVVQKLKQLGVEKIDIVIATHPHSDHIGGLSAVLSAFPVDLMIMPDLPSSMVPTTKVYTQLLQTAADRNVSIVSAKPGLSYPLGEGTLEILGPVKQNYTELNSWSVPAKFTYGNVSFLLCGDMEKDAEQDMIKSGQNLHSTVFKLNHHGSTTSNTSEFLNAVGAQAYVIEVGKNNKYGLPKQKVLSRLGQTPVYRTDIDGTITFVTNGQNLSVTTEQGEKNEIIH